MIDRYDYLRTNDPYIYHVVDYNNVLIPLSFYLAYCHYYHNSILSFVILLYCAIIVLFIFQINFHTYDINISEDNAIVIHNIRIILLAVL